MKLHHRRLGTWALIAFWSLLPTFGLADSIFERLDHRRIPSGVRVPAVLSETVGVDPYNADCEVRALRVFFYSPEDSDVSSSDFGFLVPKNRRHVPAIAILPNSIGTTMVEGDLAGAFCRSGFAVAFPDGKRGMPETLAEAGAFVRTEIILTRTLIDYLQTVPEVNRDRIGVAGVSYGAIMSGILLGVEPRIQAAMLLAGGADIPQIMSQSQDSAVREFRETQMRANHIRTPAELLAALRQNIPYDALDPALAPALKRQRDRVLQYTVDGDTFVPTTNQEQLWQALGQPRRVVLRPAMGGHVGAILGVINSRLDEVASFFHARLDR